MIITDEYSGLRVDKASSLIPDALGRKITRNQIQKAIKNGALSLNGAIIRDLSSKVKVNDIVEFSIDNTSPEHLVPASIPIDIVYEDDELIVINKQAGITTHPGAGTKNDTLVHAILHHTTALSNIACPMRPGIVHRLDRDTSGLMVVAKNNNAHNNLATQIQDRRLHRKYIALVFGRLNPLSGIIRANIHRSKFNRKKMAVSENAGKFASSCYNTLLVYAGGVLSLVECTLETGRTHQIRVHMGHVGHSILGDQVYGDNKRKVAALRPELRQVVQSFNRQALHSTFISFEHPISGKRLEFKQDPPEDLNKLLEEINAIKV